MKSAPQCGSVRFCSPIVRPTSCYASTNRRSRQATYRAVCSKRATLLGNVDRDNRKAEVRAELTKRLDVNRQVFGAGEIIAIPLPNIGSMGENTAALKAPRRRTQCHSRAVLVDLLNLLSTDRGDAATRLDDDA